MTRFLIVFMLLLLSLFTIENMNIVQEKAIDPFTTALATTSVFIIEAFDDNVVSRGRVLRSTENGFAVEIQAGCNGVEAVIILVAALFAFPAPFRYKLVGLAIGIFAIQALNLVRIISLFYLGQWNMTAFEWFHLYLWQALIILDALVVWLIWLRRIPRTESQPALTA
ncbi:MAG: hypothetical protein DHS20C11_08880 [Lysobacteraceae bacterium]|nr:MAG: hypothetical protein DHS20C11_08880 [Xanthomonadaceae bacterium]